MGVQESITDSQIPMYLLLFN